MTGGEFMNCTEEQLSDIRQLIDETSTRCSDMVRLSNSLRDLEDILRGHTTGESVEPLYSAVPEELRGYVEIFLDSEHRPSYRLIEPLLYKSNYYKPSLQSVSLGLLSTSGDRPFVLSTPRLADENHVHLQVDFNSEIIDCISEARNRPVDIEKIHELFKDSHTAGGLDYREIFVDKEPKRQHDRVQNGVRLRYTGHAGFLVETPDISLAVDPVIANRCERYADDVISFTELPEKIDFVFLTHNHQDHVNLETLLQLRHKIGTIVVPKNNGGSLFDPSLKLMLQQLRFTVVEIDELESIRIPSGQVVSIPFLGEHGDLNIRSKTAWLVEAGGKRLFFGADSSNPDIRLYEHMRDLLSNLDFYCIGMECVGAPYTWLYGALHTKSVSKKIKESRRLNGSDFDQAYEVVRLLKPKHVCIYALGMEPWYKYFMGIEYSDDSKQIVESRKLLEACQKMGIAAESLFGKREFHSSEF